MAGDLSEIEEKKDQIIQSEKKDIMDENKTELLLQIINLIYESVPKSSLFAKISL